MTKRSARSLQAEAEFRARLAATGAVLLEPEWLGNGKPHRARCTKGHECSPYPANVRKGLGVCVMCSGKDPRAAEEKFRDRVADLGGTVVEPRWLGNGKPHRVRCAKGHECSPRPGNVIQGRGICITCAGLDPRAAEVEFRARLEAMGAVLLEPAWLGSGKPHRVRCAEGHACRPTPSSVRIGNGICITCAGLDPKAAEEKFRARVADLGGTVVEPRWLGGGSPHRVRCAQGHECTPRPKSLREGNGLCRTCAGQDPKAAEAQFRARVAELGATVLEPRWLGDGTPHRVRCAEGHECTPIPSNVKQRGTLCRTCAGMDPKAAEEEFRDRVAVLGGTVVESRWLGSRTPHRVRCAKGHECSPYPNRVQQGGGICRFCAGMAWDVFYVVVNPVLQRVKFGITSGDPRPRLSHHNRDGYTQCLRLLEGLPDDAAPLLEKYVMAELRREGHDAVHGREYFDIEALPVILRLVDPDPA